MRYSLTVLGLWLTGKIAWRTLRYALRERPVALLGRRGTYIVDADFLIDA